MGTVRSLLLLGLAGLAGMGCLTTPQEAPDHLNVVLILIDDMGWRDPACFGSDLYETPHINGLADDGMRFTNAYAAAPNCSPTRASVLTGKYPARLNLTDYLPGRNEKRGKLTPVQHVQQLPFEEETIAEALRKRGYATAAIGKWHLGKRPSFPEDHGFDTVFAAHHQGHHDRMFFPYGVPDVEKGAPGEYLTDRLTDEALRFIDEHRDQPFFLYLSHYAVHRPIEGKEAHVAYYEKKRRREMQHRNPEFAAMVHGVDESTGRIMRLLEKRGLDRNTLVIFTSDNGSLRQLSSPAPLRAGKGTLYEGGIRVPLILWAPGQVAAGQTNDSAVSTIDFAPTILDMADGRAPALTAFDGRSLKPLLDGQVTLEREAVYWHFPHYSNHGFPPAGAVRAGDYKLIEFYEDNQVELYDLTADISESHDLASKEPETATQLQKMLHDWRTSVNARMPGPNPNHDPEKTTWMNKRPGE